MEPLLAALGSTGPQPSPYPSPSSAQGKAGNHRCRGASQNRLTGCHPESCPKAPMCFLGSAAAEPGPPDYSPCLASLSTVHQAGMATAAVTSPPRPSQHRPHLGPQTCPLLVGHSSQPSVTVPGAASTSLSQVVSPGPEPLSHSEQARTPRDFQASLHTVPTKPLLAIPVDLPTPAPRLLAGEFLVSQRAGTFCMGSWQLATLGRPRAHSHTPTAPGSVPRKGQQGYTQKVGSEPSLDPRRSG